VERTHTGAEEECEEKGVAERKWYELTINAHKSPFTAQGNGQMSWV